MTDHEEDIEYEPQGIGIPGFVLPILTAGVALLVGFLFGGLLIWLLKPAEVVEKLVPRNYTEAELERACAPYVLEKTNEIQEVGRKVTILKSDLADREAELAKLKKKSKGGGKFMAEFKRMKAEVADLHLKLEVAENEKVRLIEELEQTVAELEDTQDKLVVQKEKTELAKEDALTNKWHRFIKTAELEVCDHGGRKKLGRCRETVAASLMTDRTRDTFAHCVRAGQEVPSVHEREKKASLPEYATFLGEDNKVTRDWYVLMCDPTLPESEDGFLREEHLPGAKVHYQDDGGFKDIPEDDAFELEDIDE